MKAFGAGVDGCWWCLVVVVVLADILAALVSPAPTCHAIMEEVNCY